MKKSWGGNWSSDENVHLFMSARQEDPLPVRAPTAQIYSREQLEEWFYLLLFVDGECIKDL